VGLTLVREPQGCHSRARRVVSLSNGGSPAQAIHCARSVEYGSPRSRGRQTGGSAQARVHNGRTRVNPTQEGRLSYRAVGRSIERSFLGADGYSVVSSKHITRGP
jgi:hypothetical protein